MGHNVLQLNVIVICQSGSRAPEGMEAMSQGWDAKVNENIPESISDCSIYDWMVREIFVSK